VKLSKKTTYLLPPLLFVLDTFFLGLLGQPLAYSLLCFYTLILFRLKNAVPLIFTLFFLAIQSQLVDGYFGLSLVYLLPLSIANLEAKRIFNKTNALPYLFLILTLVVNDLIIETFALKLQPLPLFTTIKIAVNLSLLLIFDKIFSQR